MGYGQRRRLSCDDHECHIHKPFYSRKSLANSRDSWQLLCPSPSALPAGRTKIFFCLSVDQYIFCRSVSPSQSVSQLMSRARVSFGILPSG